MLIVLRYVPNSFIFVCISKFFLTWTAPFPNPSPRMTAILNVHYSMRINLNEVVDEFMSIQPKRSFIVEQNVETIYQIEAFTNLPNDEILHNEIWFFKNVLFWKTLQPLGSAPGPRWGLSSPDPWFWFLDPRLISTPNDTMVTCRKRTPLQANLYMGLKSIMKLQKYGLWSAIFDACE